MLAIAQHGLGQLCRMLALRLPPSVQPVEAAPVEVVLGTIRISLLTL